MRIVLLSSSPLFMFPLFLIFSCNLGYSIDDFPSEFVFGAGISAYQYEGAVAEDGRTPSIWDTYTHAGKMIDKSNADVAADGYHKYKEDVKLMKDIGLEAYKFSISWSRLIPDGRGAINPKGLKYYNSLIDELLRNGIQPHVTLLHLDLPQVLEDEYGGWLSPKIIDDFKEYADVCFRNFGDRVSHWTTVQEPNVAAIASYDSGFWPPERCSYPFGIMNCSSGNSTIEPYIALHNTLLAHAAVVNLYRTKYQGTKNGFIGINVYSIWYTPFSNSTADTEATQRATDFYIGWVINPLVYGEYPKVMQQNAGKRLPRFSEAEAELVKGAFDFIGLNHYRTAYVSDSSNAGPIHRLRDYNQDMFAYITDSRNETPGGQFIPPPTVHSDPAGLQKMLEYLKNKYGNPPIYIQENGYMLNGKDILNDTDRINFLNDYIGSMHSAIREGSDVRGYFVWSFLDVWEFLGGYRSRFGLYYVDFEDSELRREPKLSAHWYYNFIMNKKGAHIRRPGPQKVSQYSEVTCFAEVKKVQSKSAEV